jgi:ketosteroid isomerase-like protein
MSDPEKGYINFYETLGLEHGANPGEIRKTYKKKMKQLVADIAQAEITESVRNQFLLSMAQLNGAVYVLRDKALSEAYWNERADLIKLEQEWSSLPEDDMNQRDAVRQRFDSLIRHFLSHYVEEIALVAGLDKEVVEASHWNQAHARHAGRILRHYRHNLYHDILERLPFYEVTTPDIDWEERKQAATQMACERV